MKNWKPIAVLVLFAVACGGTAQPTNSAMTEPVTQRNVECSLTLPGNSDAATIQQTVQDVTDGVIDACDGALPHRNLYAAKLERIDRGTGPDPVLVLVFWLHLLHPTQPPYLQP